MASLNKKMLTKGAQPLASSIKDMNGNDTKKVFCLVYMNNFKMTNLI